MKLLTKMQEQRLRQNHRRQMQSAERDLDFVPVLKLFAGSATWLLTELDEDNVFFGLCDLGMGFPELGSVSLEELEAYSGFPAIERDLYFCADKPLSDYANEARLHQRIIA